MFTIRMGIPEMEEFWDGLEAKVDSETASKTEITLYKKIGKALVLLANDPRYPGLNSHEISSLTARYGQKVWESYLENKTPAAGRIFWTYGPGQGDITIVAIEPHPNDKSNAYKKITLSAMGEVLK
ncbi:hypothetical protein [Eubacterium pyruvativorans]|uniref:hypothetical protein n=1 Tax=Eubacterium pyruvativorans TaxID=155865 RepID=UPI00088ADFF0|nr:hypothetical protein [Eubacterium pyruvativorans]SDF17266.1 hypothetical protein SAMN04487889_11238 [Eubacterium pyruvativorans]